MIRPPLVGWLVVGMLLSFAAWGAFGTVAFARRGKQERRAGLLADSLDALLARGRCVWVAPEPARASPPADTVRRR